MKRWLKVTSFFALILVGGFCGQEVLLFPALIHAQRFRLSGKPEVVPLTVERFLVATPEENDLVTWRLQPTPPISDPREKRVAVVFHSGHDTLTSTLPLQKWLRDIGFTSYSFDYRGFGESTGWPSEAGLYADADALTRWVAEREQMPPSGLVVLATGTGAAIGASAAAHAQARSLLLVSPTVDMAHDLGRAWESSFARRLLRYDLPTADFISRLQTTCLIVVAPEASDPSVQAISNAYRGSMNPERFVSSTRSNSADLLRKFQPQLQKVLRGCTPRSSTEQISPGDVHG